MKIEGQSVEGSMSHVEGPPLRFLDLDTPQLPFFSPHLSHPLISIMSSENIPTDGTGNKHWILGIECHAN